MRTEGSCERWRGQPSRCMYGFDDGETPCQEKREDEVQPLIEHPSSSESMGRPTKPQRSRSKIGLRETLHGGDSRTRGW